MQLTTPTRWLLLAYSITLAIAAPISHTRRGCYVDETGLSHCDDSTTPFCYDDDQGQHVCVAKRAGQVSSLEVIAPAQLDRRGGCWIDQYHVQHCDNTPVCYTNDKGEKACIVKRDDDDDDDNDGDNDDGDNNDGDSDNDEVTSATMNSADDAETSSTHVDPSVTKSPYGGGCWRDADGTGHCDNTPHCYNNEAGQQICVVKRSSADDLNAAGGCWVDESGAQHCDDTPTCWTDPETGVQSCVL